MNSITLRHSKDYYRLLDSVVDKKRALPILIVLYPIIHGICLMADYITVNNMTDQNLFVRIYYYQGSDKSVVARDEKGNVLNIVKIPANGSKKI